MSQKNVIQVTGEGSVWNLHTNRVRTVVDNIGFESPLMLAHYVLGQGATAPQTTYNNDVLLKVENGGVITNFCGWIGGYNSGAKVRVDHATVYGRGVVNVGRDRPGTNNVMEVVNGGLVRGIDEFHVGQYAKRNRLRVAGAESRLACKNFYVGYRDAEATDNAVEIENGGSLQAGNQLLVGRGGVRNTLRIDGTGSGAEGRIVSLGAERSAMHNVLEVRNGGVLDVYGNDDSTSGLRPFSAGSGNRLSVTGKDSVVKFLASVYAGESDTATNNLIDVSDGGLLQGRPSVNWACLYLIRGAWNTVRVRDGGKVELDLFAMGRDAGGDHSRSNTLEIVGGDSKVTIRQRMYLNGVDNAVAISNGLLRVQGPLWSGTVAGRTSRVELEGAAPRIEAKAYTNMNTRLVFKVPEGGFAAGARIQASQNLYVDSSCSLEVVADNLAPRTAVLMEGAGTVFIADALAANARITGKYASLYRLQKSADGKRLLLRPQNGTMLLLR